MNPLATLRLISHVLFFRVKNPGPRQYPIQWNNYWSSIQKTGIGGQVLWDTGPAHAAMADIEHFQSHFDPSLPMLDLGCGNGRQSRFLATRFNNVIGIDVSPAAIELARKETDSASNIEYQVANMVHVEEAQTLASKFGAMNIYMRGVLHVIQNADRPSFITSLRILLGEKGTLYQTELTTAALNYFRTLPGDSASGLPQLLHRVMEYGIQPIGFRPEDRMRYFPEANWNILAEGPSTITTVPLAHGEVGKVPATYLIARPKISSQWV